MLTFFELAFTNSYSSKNVDLPLHKLFSSEENSSQYFRTEKPGFIEDDSVINQKFLLPKFIIRDLIVKKYFRKICANFHTNLQTMHT